MNTHLIDHLQTSLNNKGSQPLYQQLQRAIRQAIELRLLNQDDALPSERQLATELAISRITVRKAIDGLIQSGLLVSRHGSGNFVNQKIDKNFSKITSFSEDMRTRGLEPRSEWIKRAEGVVNPEEAIKLALSPGTTVYRLNRLRFADNAPMAIERATIVGWALPSIDAVQDSLYEALERVGNRPVRALQRLHAFLLKPDQAKLLNAQPNDAGLLVERIGYVADGRAVELSQSFYRGDTYDFISELT